MKSALKNTSEGQGVIEKSGFKELLEIIHFTEQLSTKLHGHDENEIFSIIKDQFLKSRKYYITILKLMGDHSCLQIIETTFSTSKKNV